jgi:hypothetical protein
MKSNRTIRLGRRAAGLALGLGLVIGGFAKPAAAVPPPERDWDLSVNVYGWLTEARLSVDGNVEGGYPGQQFTQYFNDDLIDAFNDWDGGGGGDIAFRYHRFVGRLEGAWVQSDFNSDGWLTNSFADAKFGFRVLDIRRPWSGDESMENAPRASVDLLVGARYRYMDIDVDVPNLVRDARQDWVDGIIGISSSVGLFPNLTLEMVADVGGFNIGSSSQLTYNLNPRLNYRAFDHFNIFVGYKHLKDEREGAKDVTLSGPQAGIGYSF